MKSECESLCLYNINVDSKKMKTYNSQTYKPKFDEERSNCELNGDHFSKDGKVLYMKHLHRDLGKVDLSGTNGITRCYRLAYHAVSQENSKITIKEKEDVVQTECVETDVVYSASLTGIAESEELYRRKAVMKKGRNGNNEIESENVCVSEGNTEGDEKKKILKSKRKGVGDKKEKKDNVMITNEELGPSTFGTKVTPEENVEKEAPQLVNDIGNNKESNDNDILSLPKKPIFKKINLDSNSKEPNEVERDKYFFNTEKAKLEELKAKVKPNNPNKEIKEPFFSDNLQNPLFSFINTADTKSYKNLLDKIKSSKNHMQKTPNIDNDDFYNPKESNHRSSIFDSIKPYSIAMNEYQSSANNLFFPNQKNSDNNVEINGVKAPKSIKELKDKFYASDSNTKTSLKDISGMIHYEENKYIWGEQGISNRSQLQYYPINYKPFNWYIVDSIIYPPNNMHEAALKIDNQRLLK